MNSAQVARRSGIPRSALRFYEEKGLIGSIGRHGLRRLLDPAVLDPLALIALGRKAGFSLEEIARIVAAKAEELNRTIRRLSDMRDGLRHAAACPAPSRMECPNSRRYLNAAAGTKGGRRRKISRTTG